MRTTSLSGLNTDDELLEELANGKSLAFDLIFNKYYDSLCRFAYSLIHDADMSQSLVQNVFIKLWERRFILGEIENLAGYLTSMVKNQISDYLKVQRRIDVSKLSLQADIDNSTEQEILSRNFEEFLIIALSKLPPRCKLAFELSRFECLSNKEIALEMNISVKGVEALIGRSLKSLRKELIEFLPSFKLNKKDGILFIIHLAKMFFNKITTANC